MRRFPQRPLLRAALQHPLQIPAYVLRLLRFLPDLLLDLLHRGMFPAFDLLSLFPQEFLRSGDIQRLVRSLAAVDQIIPQPPGKTISRSLPCLPDEHRIVKILRRKTGCEVPDRREGILRLGSVRLTDHLDALLPAVKIPVDPVDLPLIEKLHGTGKVRRILPWFPQLVLIKAPGPCSGDPVQHCFHKCMQCTLSRFICTGDDIDPCVQVDPVICKFPKMLQVKLNDLHRYPCLRALSDSNASRPY